VKLLNPVTAVTNEAVLDVFRWDLSSYADAATDEPNRVQGGNQRSFKQRSFKHWADTLIALTAMSRVDVFDLSTNDLRKRRPDFAQ
jgi:hypothetical protein